MSSRVFFTPARSTRYEEALPRRAARLWKKAGLSAVLAEGDLTAIKLHFGEPGNHHYLRPIFVAPIVDAVRKAGAKPFLTDSNTLYRGGRANAVDHLWTAIRHGFTPPVIDAPVIIADGLHGHDSREVEVNLKHCKTVRMGAAVIDADALVVVSHFKGHMAAGFGGAIKNLGMGAASRSGKQVQHSDVLPSVDKKACLGCGVCVRWCPAGAIAVRDDGRAEIDPEACIGCAECVVSCVSNAIKIRWDASADNLQEKMAEHAYGAVAGKKGKVAYVNYIVSVTPDCDCLSWSDTPLVPDVGIAASLDPVALDQACVDLVLKQRGVKGSRAEGALKEGEDKLRQAHPDIDYTSQLKYAEEIGLGSRDYELVTV